MADDLDDQWKLSDNDKDSDEGEDKVEEDSQLVTARKSIKRKSDDDDGGGDDNVKAGIISNDDQSPAKKKKRRNRRRITEEPKEELSKHGTNEDVRTMMLKSVEDKLHVDVLKEVLPDPAADFYTCNSALKAPSEYFSSILPNWRDLVKKNIYAGKNGSPCVLVVTSSAVRAVNLIRDLKDFSGDKCKVAKLFSKHLKIEDQKKFLSKSKCQLGVGTPNRLLALIKQGILQTESLVAIVLDWNWRNPKMKRLPDVPEIQSDLTVLLMEHLMGVVKGSASACKLALL